MPMLCMDKHGTDYARVGKTKKIMKNITKSYIFWILATSFVFLCKNPERWPHHDSVPLCLPAHKSNVTEINHQLVGQYYEQYPYCTLVQTSTNPWNSMKILENSQHHRAVTRVLLGVRDQVIYQKAPTPRAWSIARVKSRVARFYARIFLCYLKSKSWKSTSGDADHPRYIGTS